MSQNGKSVSLVSRRQALILLGAFGGAMIAGRSNVYSASPRSNDGKLPACVVTPKQTEGPFFIDEQLKRSDIRVDPSDDSVKAGVPLHLNFRVSAVGTAGCSPLSGAIVDVWQCDAVGTYSAVNERDPRSAGKHFLRGYQVTDANGSTQFTTIYPGWYPGRTVHIHFKVRADPQSGKAREITSQLYFDDALTDRIHAQQPYSSKGRRSVKNQQDGLFRSGGGQLMLSPVESGEGYRATFDIGLQMA
ncbi:MAG TPA: intradiol ring-cleavage dioxygenase [Candidatus Binatia bacterium]